MKKRNFTGILQELIDRAESGDSEDDKIQIRLIFNGNY